MLSGRRIIPDFFHPEEVRARPSCTRARPTRPLPERIQHRPDPVDTEWVAVKNKYFAQILATPEEGPASAFTIHARRLVSEAERAAPDDSRNWSKMAMLTEVAATMHFPATQLAPGSSLTRRLNYYVGPKKYASLKEIGKQEVMEFGWSGGLFGWLGALLRWLCPALLWLLNQIHRGIPNYGVAIILLTILIRLVFWPVMKKSTDHMKKMQQMQPMLKELQAKHGKDQQKYIKAQQKLFKEHKVSPLGGCLPMFVQIPVFIGLFTVLRSATELHFADFLWISDLSEPENLLIGVIPFGKALNILPLLMTATMIWQQKLTPAAGDAQQQKMMATLMPVMMLFLFYNMASALVLYWTTSQSLGIVQLLLRNRADKKDSEDGEPAAATG